MKPLKKEEEELLLRETKKTLQKELAHLKKRKILTPEELLKMKEARQWWDERIHKHPGIPFKFTPLEELQFEFYRAKRRLVCPKVERMIFNCKSGPYDQSLKELEYFDINVRDLLLRILRLEEKRDSLYNRVNELQDEQISSLKKIVRLNEKILGIPEESPLRVV